MRITQGTFSFLPDLTDDEIRAQVDYRSAAAGRCRSSTPTTRIPQCVLGHVGLPMFTVKDGAAVLFEVNACRKAFPNHYIKVNAFDNTRGVESMCLSFIVTGRRKSRGSACSGRKRPAAWCATRRRATPRSARGRALRVTGTAPGQEVFR